MNNDGPDNRPQTTSTQRTQAIDRAIDSAIDNMIDNMIDRVIDRAIDSVIDRASNSAVAWGSRGPLGSALWIRQEDR